MEACLLMKLCMLEQMCHFYAGDTGEKAGNRQLPAFAMAEFFFEKGGEKVETVVPELSLENYIVNTFGDMSSI